MLVLRHKLEGAPEKGFDCTFKKALFFLFFKIIIIVIFALFLKGAQATNTLTRATPSHRNDFWQLDLLM